MPGPSGRHSGRSPYSRRGRTLPSSSYRTSPRSMTSPSSGTPRHGAGDAGQRRPRRPRRRASRRAPPRSAIDRLIDRRRCGHRRPARAGRRTTPTAVARPRRGHGAEAATAPTPTTSTRPAPATIARLTACLGLHARRSHAERGRRRAAARRTPPGPPGTSSDVGSIALALPGPPIPHRHAAAVELRVGEVDAVVAHALGELEQLVGELGVHGRGSGRPSRPRAAGRRRPPRPPRAPRGRCRWRFRVAQVRRLAVDEFSSILTSTPPPEPPWPGRTRSRDRPVLAHARPGTRASPPPGRARPPGSRTGSGEADGSARLTTPWPAAVPPQAATRAASASQSTATGRTRDEPRDGAEWIDIGEAPGGPVASGPADGPVGRGARRCRVLSRFVAPADQSVLNAGFQKPLIRGWY